MAPSPSTRSSKRNPCEICGRTKDGDCETLADGRIYCHRGTTHHPPEGLKPGDVVNGFAYLGETNNGRAMFKPNEPRSPTSSHAKVVQLRRPPAAPAAEPITGYVALARLPLPWPPEPERRRPHGYLEHFSQTQWVEVVRKGADDKASHYPHHLAADGTGVTKAGPDPWPLYGETEALAAAGGWVLETEGPKCADFARAGGLVAISQPGHARAVEQIRPRYARLVATGVAGVVFLIDNDEQGQQLALKAAEAAAAEGLRFLPLPAADVWLGIPEKGSIDDAPGTPAERVAAIEAAFAQALADQEGDPEPEVGEAATAASAAPIDQWEAAIRASLNPEHPSYERNSIRRQIKASTIAAELGLRVSPAQTRQRILQIQRAMVTGDEAKGTAGGDKARITAKEWLVDGLIAKGCLSGIAAFNKVGKTKMAARLAADVIFGRPFLGRFPVAPGPHRFVLWWVDQPAADSAAYLKAVGLMEPDGTLHPQIVRLYTEEDDLAWDDAGADLLLEHAGNEPGLVLITDSFFHSIQRIYGSDQEPEAGGALIDVQTLLAPFGVTHVCLFHSPKDTGPIGIQAIRGHGSAGGAVSACISLHFIEKRCPLKKIWIADKENPHRRMVIEGRAPFQDLLIRGDFERGTFEVVGEYQRAMAELLADERQAQKVEGLTEEQRQVLEAIGGLADPKGGNPRQIALILHDTDSPTKSQVELIRKQCKAMVKRGLLREVEAYGMTLFSFRPGSHTGEHG